MKYDGSSWSVVEYAGISDANSCNVRLTIDSNNNIYVSYIGDYHTGIGDLVTVMKWSPYLH